MSSGSKPVTTMGTRNRCGDGAIFVHAGDRADVPRGQEALHPVRRRLEHGHDRRRHEDVGDQGGEVLQSRRAAWATAIALAGAVVSKPTAKKTTSRSGCRSASPTASIGE